VLFAIISLLVFISIKTYKSPIQRKLIGSWNIEYANSYWERNSFSDLNGCIMNIDKDTINLPPIKSVDSIDYKGKTLLDKDIFDDKELLAKHQKISEGMFQNAKGTWKVINTNPDSVFFNAPKNPLHGKYAIRFFIDKKGWLNMPRLIYKVELKNDSTYLICNKAGFIYKSEIRDWESKN
jgi:hypothetical protein